MGRDFAVFLNGTGKNKRRSGIFLCGMRLYTGAGGWYNNPQNGCAMGEKAAVGEKLEEKAKSAGVSLLTFFKWVLVAVAVGLLVGGVGTLFSYAVQGATQLRTQFPWLLYLLPAAGLVIVLLYRACRVPEPKGTDLVITAVRSRERIPFRMAPLIFISTVLTHLCGGSAGREGAALQLGGSLGHWMSRVLRIQDHPARHVFIMCGMSAAFSALFGTPLAATVFALELVSVGVMYYMALVPCAISAVVAVGVARLCGVQAEQFTIEVFPALTVANGLRAVLLAVLCAGLSIVMCLCLHQAGKLYHKAFRNAYLRVAVGGGLVIALTLLVGSRDYLGAGMDVIAAAVEQGHALPWAFALKLLFTAVTLGAGFKGGEIVPTFFVGATFGCWMGGLLGLPPGFAAALGMAALFCGVTNCPMTTLMLAFELFSFQDAAFFLIVVAVSYMLSGYSSLYSSQKVVYSKLQATLLQREAEPEAEREETKVK